MRNNTYKGSTYIRISYIPAGQVQEGNNNCQEIHQECTIPQSVPSGCFQEAGLRACCKAESRHHQQQCNLWAQTHNRWTCHDWRKVLFTDEVWFCLTRGDGRTLLVIEWMCMKLRPGTDLEVEDSSWFGAVCHSIIGLSFLSLHAIATLCVTGKTSSPFMVPLLQAYPEMTFSMTMPPAILLVLCVISWKTGLSVFYTMASKEPGTRYQWACMGSVESEVEG